jgi:uncharacterized protein
VTLRPVGGLRLLASLGLWVLLGGSVFVLTILALRVAAPGWTRTHTADLSAILIFEAYVTLLAALTIAFGPRGLRDRLGLRFTSAADVLLAFGVWIVALIAGLVVTAALSPLIGQPQGNAAPLLRESFDPLFVGLIVPTVCLLAPLTEELLFRGALFGWLHRFLPALPAIVLVAAVFAGAHLLPTLFPVLFVFGLGATWVRNYTGSTFNSFVMHASQNTFAVAVTYAILTHPQR